jgi:hypothetical protein
MVEQIRAQGIEPLREIAEELNRLSHVGRRGGKFHAPPVRGGV